MRQHAGLGVLLAQQLELQAFELVVDDAGAVPQQHVGAGLLLDVAAQMPVGCPQDLLPQRSQVAHDGHGARAGHHPVGACLDGRTAVGVDHHGAVGVRVAERGERVGRAAQVERAGGLQIGHQHALGRRQDLGRLTHETNAGDDQRAGRMVAAETGHLERVGDAATGLERQVLQVAIDVVVGDEHRVARSKFLGDVLLQVELTDVRRRLSDDGFRGAAHGRSGFMRSNTRCAGKAADRSASDQSARRTTPPRALIERAVDAFDSAGCAVPRRDRPCTRVPA